MESNTTSTRRLWASFPDYELAAQAVAAFIDHGVPKDQIHLMAENLPKEYSTRWNETAPGEYTTNASYSYSRDHVAVVNGTPGVDNKPASDAARDKAEGGITTTTAKDAKIGAEKGMGVGLGVGILAGLTALAVPGFGLVIGGSALAIAAAGAAGATAAGALAGAVTGYLKDQGADDHVVKHVTERLAAGDVVININMDPDLMTQSDANALVLKYGGTEYLAPIPAGARA